ncbi:restriction endonuclease subunit S [Janibacter anophelis]|uniref:restriction endonuclease subunit S n=1 Tax=Janibacter anophelis TaxID=319054 RepID=UPI000A0387F8|nr:restriction endonuclease subunit S [Janibacter anophelis]
MAELSAQGAVARPRETVHFGAVSKGYTVFRDQDILAAKITPCWENGKVGQAHLGHEVGVGSTEFHVVRAKECADPRYLMHFLRLPSVRATGELRMTGSGGQRRVPPEYLRSLQVPTPSLDEQRRIAAILDHADALRAKRRQVLAHLDDLTQSVFQSALQDDGAESVAANELMPHMRNGLSPSSGGAHRAKVLTLSAITRGRFNPSAAKEGDFATEPPEDKCVAAIDFLMCRGNGNPGLVGVGVFVPEDRFDLVFPDTVIAGRVDSARVLAPILEVAWRQPSVRRQIEQVARTTNGTYKVNQKSLASVHVAIPPLAVQRATAGQFAKIDEARTVVLEGQAADEALFASLQARAFSGEL